VTKHEGWMKRLVRLEKNQPVGAEQRACKRMDWRDGGVVVVGVVCCRYC
jgi:hypothetical protein